MNIQPPTARFLSRLALRVACLLPLLASPALLVERASAATLTWNGAAGGAGDWSAANWVSGTPAAGDLLQFGGTTTPITNNNITADTNFIGINLTNNGSAGQTSNFTLSGNRITLGGNINTTAATTGSLTDTISLGMILSANRSITTGTNHNLTISGVISESGGARVLTKSSTGTLVLSGNNTFSGGITIAGSGGNVTAGHNNALGTGTVTLAGANAFLQLADGITIANAMTVSATGNAKGITLQSGATSATYSGNITNSEEASNNFDLNVGTGGTLTVSGIISSGTNSSGLDKQGTGTLILTGNNTYTNTTHLSVGVLNIQHNNALGTTAAGTTVASGAALELQGGITIGAEALTINGTGISSGGALRNISGDNSYAGAITLAAASRINSDAGLLTLSGAIGGTFALTVGGAGNTTISNAIGTSTGTLTKDGVGTLTLSGANTYNGTTTISAGTLALSGGSAIANNGAVTLANATSTALDVNSSETIGNLSGGGSLGGNIAIASGQTLTVNQTSSLSYNGSISGDGGLTINGTNQLQLMGNNSFTGMTTVNSGTLRLQGPATNTTIVGDITINGGSLLFGVGMSNQIADASSVTLTNGNLTLSTAGEIIASLTMSGGTLARSQNGLTLNSASSFTGGTVNFSHAAGRITANGTTTFGNVTFDYSLSGNATSGLYLGGNIVVNASTTANFTNSAGGLGRIDLNGANRTIDVGTGAAMNVGWTIAGTSVGITKNGSGTLALNAANTYNGTTTINAGTIDLGANQNIGAISGAGALNLSTYTLTTNASSNTTFSGIISGTGSLTKNGTGTLTLSNTNTYNGSTTINTGTLAVSGDIANSGLVINSGGIISPGTSAAADSFGTSSITINGGGYNWTLASANGSAGTDWDQITSTGALTSSGVLTVYAYGTPGDWDNAANYSWDIFSANSVSGFSAGNFTMDFSNFGIGVGNRTGTWAFTNPSGGIIRLTYTAASGPVWAGGTGNWNAGFTPAVTDGANIAFTGAGGTATNNISTGTLTTVGDIEFRSGAGAYTLAADAGSAGASGGTALTVTGSITNNSTAAQTINTDLAFAATRTIAATAGNITIGGAISGAGGLTKNGSNKLTLTAANTYTGDTTINTGTLEIGSGSTSGSLSSSSAITNNANLVFNRSNDLTVSNTIGGTGNLTKSGAGTLTLSGASSSYTGTTTLSGGTIQIGHANGLGNGGNITFSGGGLKYDTGIATDLSSRIKNSGSAILVDTNGESVTWGTALSSTNTGGLTKNGSGTLQIQALSAYSGVTNINSGTLQINNTGGTLTWGAGSVAINNGSTLEFTGSGQTLFLSSDNITFDSGGGGAILLTYNPIFRDVSIATTGGSMNTISGTFINCQTSWGVIYDTAVGTDAVGLEVSSSHTSLSDMTKNGAGTLRITNSVNSLNGSLIINSGTLEIGGAGRLQSGSYSSNINNKSTFTYNSTANQTLSGVVYGIGQLIKSNSSTLTLSGNNTYSGVTTVNAGTIEIGAAGRLGAGTYAQNISNNGTLIYSGTNAQTLSGVISGTGALTQNASSTLTLTNANTYSGATTINVGTVVIGAGGTTGSLSTSSSITVNGTLAFNRSDNITQGTHFSTAAIGGTGSIVQNGTGNLTLNAANTYSGGTTLNTGTVVIGHANAAGSGTITQTDATSLLKFDTTGTITNTMSVYNVLATQSATLSGAITVNNATWDIETGDTLTVSGDISGSGGVTKNGGGTLILSGSNSYNGSTVVNTGTLNAANANALGSNNTVEVNGGTLLVSADDAVNGKNIDLGGSGIGLQFSGNYSGAIGNLTLSANSIIDLGPDSVRIMIQGLTMSSHTLSFYNWSGLTLWNGGTGSDTDRVYFGPDLSDEALAKIYFYSGPGDSFLGSGFDLGLKATGFSPAMGYQIIPVPEPETWATGILLVLGSGVWLWRKRKNFSTQSNLEGAAPSAPIDKMVGLFRRNDPNQRQSRPRALPANSATT